MHSQTEMRGLKLCCLCFSVEDSECISNAKSTDAYAPLLLKKPHSQE